MTARFTARRPSTLKPSNSGGGSDWIACDLRDQRFDLVGGRDDAQLARLDRVEQPAPAEIVPEALQRRELLPGQLLLGLQLLAQHPGLDQFALHQRHALALGAVELGELGLALAILLLPREFGAELLEPLAGDAPERLQLEIREALVALVGAAEVLLERRHLLLDAHRRAFLQLEAVEQPVALVVERREFLLELDAIAEQREQPFVFDGWFATGQPVGQPAQALRQAHSPQPALPA